MVKKKKDQDTLRNFDIDFDNLRKEFLSYAEYVFRIASYEFMILSHSKDVSIVKSHHMASLTGFDSNCFLVDKSKKSHALLITVSSSGKIILKEQKSLRSKNVIFEEKMQWDSFKKFIEEFKKFLIARKVRKKSI